MRIEHSAAGYGHDALTYRVVDALYVELASQLQAALLTVDRKPARVCALADDITA